MSVGRTAKKKKCWVLSEIWKTFRKFNFRRKFHIWQITADFFEWITLMTEEKYRIFSNLIRTLFYIFRGLKNHMLFAAGSQTGGGAHAGSI